MHETTTYEKNVRFIVYIFMCMFNNAWKGLTHSWSQSNISNDIPYTQGTFILLCLLMIMTLGWQRKVT